jgi:hypothetical protein
VPLLSACCLGLSDSREGVEHARPTTLGVERAPDFLSLGAKLFNIPMLKGQARQLWPLLDETRFYLREKVRVVPPLSSDLPGPNNSCAADSKPELFPNCTPRQRLRFRTTFRLALFREWLLSSLICRCDATWATTDPFVRVNA